MKTEANRRVKVLAVVLLTAVFIGCGNISINAEMSDQQILAAFGIDIKTAESKKSQGPDGYTMSYKQGDQSVGITRSVVTGVYVYSTGPIKGEWELGKP